MSCLNPRIAYQKNDGEKPVFIHDIDYEFWSKINVRHLHYKLMLLPCGHCSECMKKKSLEWTARLMKEAEEWNYTYFITLTYDDEHIKDLNKRDIQLFLKRFRKATGYECKYYICGEYGETTSRPHYHAIFYLNNKIEDLVFYANNLFTSVILSSTWQNGQVLLSSDVNERTIKYTIGYTLKKLGESKVILMSKGLGLKYLNNKKDDIKFSNGFYLNDGFFVETPSYLKRKIKESNDPSDIEWLEQIENSPRSSIRLTRTIEDMISEMLNSKNLLKGKGAF